VAGLCAVKLGLNLPSLVDTMGNPTELAYTGWPDRLYVIDREGKIAHKSDAGPYGFKPAMVRDSLQRLTRAQQP
jgi:type I thyroxine 5'-deiodinase